MAKQVTLQTLQELYSSGESTVEINPEQQRAAYEEQHRQPEPPQQQEVEPEHHTAPKLKSASIQDVASSLPQMEVEEAKTPEVVTDAFNSMYNTLEERKQKIQEELIPIIEQNAKEMVLEKELDEDGEDHENETMVVEEEEEDTRVVKHVIEEEQPRPKRKTTKKQKVEVEEFDDASELDALLSEIDSDVEDEIEIDEMKEEETREESIERFKDSLSDIKVTSNLVDLSNFKIRKKPTSTSRLLSKIDTKASRKTADWALYYSKKAVTFTECTGPEIDNLRKTISNSNAINSVIVTLKFVYNHIEDADKPSFERWCKSIRTEDLDSLYFGLYKACYSDINYLSRYCSNENGAKGCGKASIINTDIDSMVKFADDETKKKFYSLYNSDTTTETDEVESVIIPISDNIAISYRYPTLYSTFVQYSALRPDIVEKYQDTLDTLAYIDDFYEIDRSTNELIPVEIKEYPGNLNKTVLSRIKAYVEILKSLSSDQYNILMAKLQTLVQEQKITYVYPETECPECGMKIEESPVESMLQLLFTRAQLVQIKSL